MSKFTTTIKIDDDTIVIISKTPNAIIVRAELHNTTGKSIRGMNIFICSLSGAKWIFSERGFAKKIFGRLWVDYKSQFAAAINKFLFI